MFTENEQLFFKLMLDLKQAIQLPKGSIEALGISESPYKDENFPLGIFVAQFCSTTHATMLIADSSLRAKISLNRASFLLEILKPLFKRFFKTEMGDEFSKQLQARLHGATLQSFDAAIVRKNYTEIFMTDAYYRHASTTAFNKLLSEDVQNFKMNLSTTELSAAEVNAAMQELKKLHKGMSARYQSNTRSNSPWISLKNIVLAVVIGFVAAVLLLRLGVPISPGYAWLLTIAATYSANIYRSELVSERDMLFSSKDAKQYLKLVGLYAEKAFGAEPKNRKMLDALPKSLSEQQLQIMFQASSQFHSQVKLTSETTESAKNQLPFLQVEYVDLSQPKQAAPKKSQHMPQPAAAATATQPSNTPTSFKKVVYQLTDAQKQEGVLVTGEDGSLGFFKFTTATGDNVETTLKKYVTPVDGVLGNNGFQLFIRTAAFKAKDETTKAKNTTTRIKYLRDESMEITVNDGTDIKTESVQVWIPEKIEFRK